MYVLATRLSSALFLLLVAGALAACGPVHRASAMGEWVRMEAGWLAFSLDG